MPRGVKCNLNAPIFLDGVPCDHEAVVFLDEDCFESSPTDPPPVRQANARTGVYFVRGGGLVKIGLARCVLERFRGLQTASPVPLAPIGFIATPNDIRDAYRLERELHERFAAQRQHGEWFTETPELTELIQSRIQVWPAQA